MEEYQAPEVEVIGSASELVQTFGGPRFDGGPHAFSQGASSPQEEE